MEKIFTLVFILVASSIIAQDTDTPFKKKYFPNQKEELKEAKKSYKKGQGKLYKGGKQAYLEALPYFKKAYEFNPNYSFLNFDYGMCLLYSSKKYKAIKYFKKAHDLNPEVSADIHLFLGIGYQLSSNWDQAIKYLKTSLDDDNMNKDEIRLAKKKIEECENGQELSQNPARVWIDNLGDTVNSKYPEYAPVVSANERRMFFTSRRPNSKGGEKDNTGEYFEDIYYTSRKFQDWEQPNSLNDSVNTNRHDATIGLSPDGRSLLVYNNENSKEGDVLITQDLGDGKWTHPKLVKGDINTKHHEPSASLSFNEDKIFFISNRPGGFGGHDIYVSYWDDESDEWGEAENLGPKVNTKYDERGVFIHPDNKTLYFSSNGHNTIGGLDVFKTELEDGSWSYPINLKPPINTPDDDVYFSVTGDGRHAYYSSYRPGGAGEKDIYRLTLLGDEKKPMVADIFLSNDSNEGYKMNGVNEINQGPSILLKGVTQILDTKKPLSARIKLKNAETGEIIYHDRSDSSSGMFYAGLEPNTRYKVEINTNDELQNLSEYIETGQEEGFVVFEEKFNLYKKPEKGQEFTFQDVFFDFDEHHLRKESYDRLDRVVKYLKINKAVTLEVGGHTDARGRKGYNRRLSRRRARVVKEYLIDHGVDDSRIESKGYGESEPFVKENEIKKMKSESSKEKAHQKNRRTAFKVLKSS